MSFKLQAHICSKAEMCQSNGNLQMQKLLQYIFLRKKVKKKLIDNVNIYIYIYIYIYTVNSHHSESVHSEFSGITSI